MPQCPLFFGVGVSQVTSNTRTQDDSHQRKLDLARRAPPNTLPIEFIRKALSSGHALSLAIQSSGLDDQEICDALDIDAGYLSRMKKGAATLQANLIAPFCEMVGNRIYPEWISFQVGCTLVQIQSESERRAEAAEARAAKAEEKARLLQEILQGRTVPVT